VCLVCGSKWRETMSEPCSACSAWLRTAPHLLKGPSPIGRHCKSVSPVKCCRLPRTIVESVSAQGSEICRRFRFGQRSRSAGVRARQLFIVRSVTATSTAERQDLFTRRIDARLELSKCSETIRKIDGCASTQPLEGGPPIPRRVVSPAQSTRTLKWRGD
jgi:hypothetical protein